MTDWHEPRVVVDLGVHGHATYKMTDTPQVGERVVVMFGQVRPQLVHGTVAAVYPTGPNWHLRLESCGECGRPGIRLATGRLVDPYYGDCKTAEKED